MQFTAQQICRAEKCQMATFGVKDDLQVESKEGELISKMTVMIHLSHGAFQFVQHMNVLREIQRNSTEFIREDAASLGPD